MIRRLRGGQAAIESLAEQGVDTIFGIPGIHTLEIYDALVDSPIAHILARHEQGAGFMADGYARASGKPGVCTVISGPGVTNVATSVGEAYTDSIPVLVLSANVGKPWVDKMRGQLHDLADQLGVMAAVTKWNARAATVAEIPSLVQIAFSHMLTGRPRPTQIEIPIDVLAEAGDVEIHRAEPLAALAPAPEALRRAADAIERADRIVMYCGGGAAAAFDATPFETLATVLGAPTFTSIMGKGSVSDRHPMAVRMPWRPRHGLDGPLREADLAIVFGSKLGAEETDNQSMPLPDNLIRVDIDPEELYRNYQPSLAIQADAAATARALLAELERRNVRKHGSTADEIRELREVAFASTFGKDHQPYIDALRSAIPDDGLLVADVTSMGEVACKRYPTYLPRTFLFPSTYGTLGYALPAALGAKVAQPDKTVVCVIGDGGFQYTMQELASAIQAKLGVPIVVFNDCAYTLVKESQASQYDRRFIGVDLKNPDFVKIAEAYGIAGIRCDTPAAMAQAIREAAQNALPTIIEVPIVFPV